jgi:peptide/nickel transport system ATP-binding protein
VTGQPVLAVEDLHVRLPTEDGVVHAVRGLSFELRPGEVLGIVGESGCGKSAASLAVLGLLPRSASVTGSVSLHGRELLGLPERELSRVRGRSLAMVFQDPMTSLNPVYRVGDQLLEAIRVHQQHLTRAAARARAVELLRSVGISDAPSRLDQFPHELSGGMRQRVVIAIAMANRPSVILADEPTTALDVTIQAQVLETLKRARAETGSSLVLITHDLGVVAGMADRVLVMYAGRAVELANAEDLFRRPLMPYTVGLLGSLPRVDSDRRRPLTPIPGRPPSLIALPPGCPFAPRCPLRQDICVDSEPPLDAVEDGHAAACHFADTVAARGPDAAELFPVEATEREQSPAGEVVLRISGLTKHFPIRSGAVLRRHVGDVRAVDGIDFELRRNETLGVVGESGSGKSTTALVVLQLLEATSGRVEFDDTDLTATRGRRLRALRRDIQIVFQDPFSSLDPRMTVNAIVGEALRIHGLWDQRGPARVAELLDLVGLNPEHGNRYPHEFSGGQRQRIGIARALALDPKVLILDEPVSALDVSVQAGIVNLLERLKARLGLSYVFIAHDLSVVRHICDRVAVMYLGRIVEIGTTDDVFERPAHPYTQALLSAIPIPDPPRERARRHIILTGEIPSPADPPTGCPFHTRCQVFAHELDEAQRARCVAEAPALADRGTGHPAACHYAAVRPVLLPVASRTSGRLTNSAPRD